MQNKTSYRNRCIKHDSITPIRKLFFYIFCVILFSMTITGCGSVFHPYNTSFRCPPGYNGMCEPLEEAYMDSVHGLDPRIYDPKWVKRRKKWEEKHKELINARKTLGYYETVEEKIKKYEQKYREGNSRQISSYREELFRELASLLKEPEAPFLVPPKVVRILILSTLSPDENNKTIYVSPHYTYFILDEPKWLLHKIPEKVPEGSANPLISY